MSDNSRDDYVKLVEVEYFGNVTKNNIPAILECFTLDARVTIYHGDAVARRFAGRPAAGESPLRDFFDHLLANYNAGFANFHHYVDPPEQRCAAHFDVTLEPKAGSAYLSAGTRHLKNCNFFKCQDGKIHDMVLYYAHPGADPTGPTGYPKAS